MASGLGLHHRDILVFCPIHTAPGVHCNPPTPILGFNSSVEPSLTLQLPALAVEFPALLSQVCAHADGVGGRLEPVKGGGSKVKCAHIFVNF